MSDLLLGSELKETIRRSLSTQVASAGGQLYFADTIWRNLELSEVSVLEQAESQGRKEARVVYRLRVEHNMLNGSETMHGGCSATIIDVCSTAALIAYNLALVDGRRIDPGVSLSLNVVYHSPASLHDELKIVNTTMTVGIRAQSIKSEIWNVTQHRLMASGVHIKMSVSPAPTKL